MSIATDLILNMESKAMLQVLGHKLTYFVKHEVKDKTCSTENKVISK